MILLGVDKSDNVRFWTSSFRLATSIIIFLFELVPKPKSYYLSLDDDENVSPEESSNIFSRLIFSWMTPLMKLGYTKVLDMDDLWTLRKVDSSAYNSANFQKNLSAELRKKRPSLVRALFYTFALDFFSSAFFKVCQDILQFTQPQLLHLIMSFAATYADGYEGGPDPYYKGLAIAFAMLATAVTQTLFLHQYFNGTFMMGMRVRSSLVTAIYMKSLRLSNSARQGSTIGEITNLMSVDATRISDLSTFLHIAWSGPFQIFVAVYFLYQTLGASVFGGILVMLLMIPVNSVIASKSRALNKVQMGNKDARTKLMDEILSGMKVIKLYAWEQPFIKKVFGIREKELATLRKIAVLASATSFTWSCAPFLVSFTTFALYSVISPEPLTSTKVFVSLSLFNLLSFPLGAFPSVIASMVDASVSFSRLIEFFKNEEKDENAVTYDFVPPFRPNDNSLIERVVIEDADISWSLDGAPTLKDLNLSLKDGSLLAVVGTVGSGKSTLLSAILGDTYKIKGSVTVRGTVAYVAQTAWIMNCTLRDNILFGLPYDAAFYDATIEACGLIPDMKQLVAGDMTEIGERGINLSGGQKQRIAIARAVYSRADIYLFDDALSAVDAHVGRHIFDKILGPNGLLKAKARLLVTHGIQYLPAADNVILLADSQIAEIGPYNQLMSSKGLVYKLIKEYGKQQSSTDLLKKEVEPVEDKPVVKCEKKDTGNAAIITKEESAKGKVDLAVYKTYAQSCGTLSVIIFIGIAMTSQCLSVTQNILLSEWAKYNDHHPNNTDSVLPWLGAYGGIGLCYSAGVFIQVLYAWVYCGIRSARVLHNDLLNNVLRLPQSFFDTTPLGRIINRFSKDQYTVDEVLARSFLMYFRTTFVVISVLAVNSFGNPYYILFAIPLGFLYYYFQRFYLTTSRELKRLDSTSRSPVYSNFQETLNGTTSIRAYGQMDRFIKLNESKVDYNQQAYYPSVCSNRWLAIRLEFIGALIVFGSASFGVLALYLNHSISASVIGLMLVYSLSVTQTLNWMVRQSCEIETNIVSVERIKEYSDLPQEAPAEIPSTAPPASWPTQGAISFRNYSTRYRSDLDLVVKDLNIDIKPKEKIGIVGRTGAGKSSLTLSLFRIIEASSGCILIDSVDISTIGLVNLRSALSIIPQDPVLFCGTIRQNLDPFENHTDLEIWTALEKAKLKDYVTSFPEGLNLEIVQGGENFSCGQRQLVCLARALVRKTKILIMDEATAAIDVETDAIIQRTIRTEMKECTILTIAHRINTVMDSDRIIVMDMGRVTEFDTPKRLLDNKSSLFYGLAKEAGQAK
ncbi:P-loop containing nucleoside triphosphate hydrolase protein [Globomyces pollinis-pini]|nr:P-loop containing nucleoside triphosphate hydrolase protein [Globomyces pollinis-pini]